MSNSCYSEFIQGLTTRKDVIINMIIEVIENTLGIPFEVITSNARTREVSDARKIIAHYLRELCGLSYNNIGRILNRDHATVIYLLSNYKTVVDVEFLRTKNVIKSRISKSYKSLSDYIETEVQTSERATLTSRLGEVEYWLNTNPVDDYYTIMISKKRDIINELIKLQTKYNDNGIGL